MWMIALDSVDKLAALNLKGKLWLEFFKQKIPPPIFLQKHQVSRSTHLDRFFGINSNQWFQQMTMKLYIWMPGNQK